VKKKVLFIINPFSGLGKQNTIDQMISKELNPVDWNWDIAFTKNEGHATVISKEASQKYDVVVAVGGDGTVNEVATGLIGTQTVMGIIPAGSGNGLARHLNIPLKVNRALQMFNQYQVMAIDVININNRYSFNVSGVGFDGHISHLFAKEKNRGPLKYIKLITNEFAKYKSRKYRITIDDEVIEHDAFLISLANSTQYGNNVHIAPGAVIDDGLIDVCVIRDFPKVTAPALLLSLFDQTIDQSKYDEIFLCKKVTIESDQDLMAHIDGEAFIAGKRLDVNVMPLALNVMVPNNQFLNSSLFYQLQDMVPTIPSLYRKK